MIIKLHVGNISGNLSSHLVNIRSSFKTTKLILEKHPTTRSLKVDFFIIDDPYPTIPELGIVGYCPNQHVAYLYIDHTKKIDREIITSQMLHELHHALRWKKVGYGETLGEALVSEGLACLVEEEVTGKAPIYTAVQLEDRIITDAKENFWDSYDHNAWFFGSNSIPRWAGYSLGYRFAKEYALKHSKNAWELANMSAKDILKEI